MLQILVIALAQNGLHERLASTRRPTAMLKQRELHGKEVDLKT